MAAAEQRKSYKVVKQFKGVNTKANRTAIDETEFSWLENAMPIGYANLKITPNQQTIGAVTFAHTVVNLFSANIKNVDYLIAIESDGSAQSVNLSTNAVSTVAAAGTFSTAGDVRFSQWKNEYALFADPTKGFYLWDGTNFLSVGSIGVIGITNGGSGYTSPPVVTISAPNQTNGTQATAICTITNTAGQVLTINMNTPGSGYTSVPKVVLSAPPYPGITATASATISSGAVVAINVVNPGSGYSSAPTVTITGGGGASANATATIDTGSVNAILLTEAGSGYTSAPTVTFSGGGGTNAAAVASFLTFAKGTIAIEVTNGGTGYTNAANTVVTITGGGGTNAAGTAILSGGQVTQVVMTNPGTGYTSAPNVAISGGGATVNATAKAVVTTENSTGIATYSGRVWLAQGRTVFYSAAGSVSDFVSVSAGNINLADSTLHGNVTQLLSANNFLYIFGDDSINVFSDVRVTTTGVTLFTNTNVSASVGSKRPYAIFPYFRSVLFMNDYGMYALVGSTTSKISDALDGIFPYIDFTRPVYAGQVLLNNILCAVFNFYYSGGQGTETNNRYIQAVFFEKKWFFTSQTDALNIINSTPVSGTINMYGTTGTDLVKLYGNTTANIASVVQTALMSMDDPIRTKQALKWGIEATSNVGYPFTVTVDSELGSSPDYTVANYATWKNLAGTIIPWQNNAFVEIPWTYTNQYFLYKSDASQWGKYLGLTVRADTPGHVINTIEFEHELRTRF